MKFIRSLLKIIKSLEKLKIMRTQLKERFDITPEIKEST